MDIRETMKEMGLVFKGTETCLQLDCTGGNLLEITGKNEEEITAVWEAVGSPDIEEADLTFTGRQLELLDIADEAAAAFLSAVTGTEDIPPQATAELLARAEITLGAMGIFLIRPSIVYDGDSCWMEEKDEGPFAGDPSAHVPTALTSAEKEAAEKFLAETTQDEARAFSDEVLAVLCSFARDAVRHCGEAR